MQSFSRVKTVIQQDKNQDAVTRTLKRPGDPSGIHDGSHQVESTMEAAHKPSTTLNMTQVRSQQQRVSQELTNSVRDARTRQPGEIVFNTMTYRSSETVQRPEYFQHSVSYIKVQIMSK